RSVAAIHESVSAIVTASDVSMAPAAESAARRVVSPSTAVTAVPLSADVEEELYRSLRRIRAEISKRQDPKLIPERVIRRVHIQPPDAYLTTEEELKNTSNTGCTDVVRIVVTDAPTSFRHLKFTAEIWVPDDASFPAVIRHEEARDGQAFFVTLGFKGRVVPPGGTVTIRWTCV